MADNKYPYSSELKAPADNSKVDYDDPKTIAGMAKIGKMFGKMAKFYHAKNGIQMKIGSYKSYDNADIPFYLFEPKNSMNETLPCIIYYHGGGFMFPVQKMMQKLANYYAEKLHCRVALPDYRISLTNTCQDILEDCASMYQYIFNHAEELHINSDQVLVYGDSAGGALAAGTTHMARDRGYKKALGQLLVYPVTDNHSERYQSVKEYPDAAWPAGANRSMWRLMFEKGTFGMENYAAPMNIEDFSELPQAYVEPQEIDILRDEAIAYGEKLKAAGIPVEINVIKGSYHGVENDWKSPLTQRLLAHRVEVMKKMLQKR